MGAIGSGARTDAAAPNLNEISAQPPPSELKTRMRNVGKQSFAPGQTNPALR